MDPLPVSTPSVPQSLAGGDPGAGESARASVLVVDDAPAIRETLAAMLRREGYEVDTADDGITGWEAFSGKAYRLLITDCAMPNLSGIELLRRVRAVSPSLPVIVISGYAVLSDTDLDRLLPPGRFIPKPFRFQSVFEAIEQLLTSTSSPFPSKTPSSGGEAFCGQS